MAADLIILEEVLLDKLHPLDKNGKLVRPYKKQLREFQLNLAITLDYLKEIGAESEKRVDALKEIKKELMYIVLLVERVHVGCMNGGALWVSVHQHLMARRLCKLNQQFRKLKNQLVVIRDDILKEQLSDSHQQMSVFRQETALIIIVCYALAYALSSLLIDQLSMQQRSRIQQQIGHILTRIDQLSHMARIQQHIEKLMITMISL